MMNNLDVPAVSREQMAEIDRLMIEEYGIALLQMMENAGRSLAELARKLLGEKFSGSRILAVCGAGNNGGGGMAAARHLHNWGADVRIALAAEPDSLKEAPRQQFNILKKMGMAVYTENTDWDFNCILDALIGYGLRGAPKGAYARWIEWTNRQESLKISLDLPSGLDADTGEVLGECVRADATLTLALPKIGLTMEQAKTFTGEQYLADIGVLLSITRQFGQGEETLFSQQTILKL